MKISAKQVIIYGPDPSDPRRTGGVAAHMRYLNYLENLSEIKVTFLYTDWEWTNQWWLPGPLRRLLGVVYASMLLLARRKEKGTAVHINTSLYPKAILRDFPFFLACRKRRYPILLQLHGGRVRNLESNCLARYVWRYMAHSSKAVGIFPGPQMKEIEYYYSNRLPVKILLNMVPKTRSPKLREDQSAHFIFLGRLEPDKGVQSVVGAFLRLRELRKDIRLSIAGTGSLMHEIREHLVASEHQAAVHLAGFVKGIQLKAIIEEANVFLLPSSHQEGLPISFLECAERGMVPVVTKNSAIPEIFREGTEFLGLDDNEEFTLYKKMALLAENRQLRNAVGQAAREAVHRCCSIDVVAPRYIELYHQLFEK